MAEKDLGTSPNKAQPLRSLAVARPPANCAQDMKTDAIFLSRVDRFLPDATG